MSSHEDTGTSLAQVVAGEGRAVVLQHSVVQHDNPIGHVHRLFLIVGDVNERNTHLLLNTLELPLHLQPQGCVEGA